MGSLSKELARMFGRDRGAGSGGRERRRMADKACAFDRAVQSRRRHRHHCAHPGTEVVARGSRPRSNRT